MSAKGHARAVSTQKTCQVTNSMQKPRTLQLTPSEIFAELNQQKLEAFRIFGSEPSCNYFEITQKIFQDRARHLSIQSQNQDFEINDNKLLSDSMMSDSNNNQLDRIRKDFELDLSKISRNGQKQRNNQILGEEQTTKSIISCFSLKSDIRSQSRQITESSCFEFPITDREKEEILSNKNDTYINKKKTDIKQQEKASPAKKFSQITKSIPQKGYLNRPNNSNHDNFSSEKQSHSRNLKREKKFEEFSLKEQSTEPGTMIKSPAKKLIFDQTVQSTQMLSSQKQNRPQIQIHIEGSKISNKNGIFDQLLCGCSSTPTNSTLNGCF